MEHSNDEHARKVEEAEKLDAGTASTDRKSPIKRLDNATKRRALNAREGVRKASE